MGVWWPAKHDDTFSKDLYFLRVEIMAYLDHYNSIKLET